MIIEFLHMGGYGLYIWMSFLIVLFSCAVFYYKTKKTLKKYEKELAKELEKLPIEHREKIAKSSKVISSILASQNKLS
mgnify:CR=1 FL=1